MKKILCCILTVLLGFTCFVGCDLADKSAPDSSSSVTNTNSIEFTQSEINLAVGESVQAEVVTSKNNVYVFWSIRDTEIATVSTTGVITAVAEGQTVCYASFGGVEAMCLIKVSAGKAEPMLSVSFAYEAITLYAGDTFVLSATAKLGDDTVDGTFVYEVADSTVVAVEDGAVLARGIGTTTVTIKAEYEGKTASRVLTVTVLAAKS